MDLLIAAERRPEATGEQVALCPVFGKGADADADPDASPVGVTLAVTSMLLVTWPSRAQRRTGQALHSSAVVADSNQTLSRTCLSAVLPGGLVLNATLGWGWADPVAGLVIAAVALQEGCDAWRGQVCCGAAC